MIHNSILSLNKGLRVCLRLVSYMLHNLSREGGKWQLALCRLRHWHAAAGCRAIRQAKCDQEQLVCKVHSRP